MFHHRLRVFVIAEQYTDEVAPSRLLQWVSFNRCMCTRTRSHSIAYVEVCVAEGVEGAQSQLVESLALDECPLVIPIGKQLSLPEHRREFAAVLRVTVRE